MVTAGWQTQQLSTSLSKHIAAQYSFFSEQLELLTSTATDGHFETSVYDKILHSSALITRTT